MPEPRDGEIVSPSTLPVSADDPEAELDRLVRRYLGAQGVLMQVVTFAGGQVEGAVARLPQRAQVQIDRAVRTALHRAYDAARATHRARPVGDGLHRTAAAALGMAGGLGGLPTALAELPVTTTAILRSIQEIARTHGEDLTDEAVRLECLRVLGSGGPLAEDDGTDFAFLGARMTLTGPALNRLIAQIAPRFAAVLGQKLAAQAVPVLGAAAGAATNLAFARYYQDMAHVHFGLRRLARGGHLTARETFRARVEASKALRRA
jgi:hypothetical protein